MNSRPEILYSHPRHVTVKSASGDVRVTDDMRKVLDIIGGLEKQETPMEFVKVNMTPEAAKELLLFNNKNNRNMRRRRIDQWRHEMENGMWKESHQPIAISSLGILDDGQNRLAALSEANVESVPMTIALFTCPQSMDIVDVGATRSVADGVNISGAMRITDKHSSVAMAMMEPQFNYAGKIDKRNIPRTEHIAFIEKHLEAISWAIQHIGKGVKYVSVTPVMAVVARAYYSIDRNVLAKFCDVVKTGIVENPKTESSAVRLRNVLIEMGARGLHSSESSRTKYRKASRALRAFIDGESLSNLYEASSEIFLLPEEVE